MMRIKVEFTVTSSDETESRSSYEMNFYEDNFNFNEFVQAIIYALPKHELPPFNVVEIFRDGESIGHGEK